ncbi:Plasma membrane t-SNARE, secretory vesicle fusion [Rhizophlyctis rosea]|nr:Plasma membrane t-SNARE, secretory vesicle fusion [Rhizophlyctis rosea]
MAGRDRTKELGGGDSQYPMQEIRLEREGLLAGSMEDDSLYWNQVESMKARIEVVRRNIAEIERLEYASLSAIDINGGPHPLALPSSQFYIENQGLLTRVTEETQILIRQLRGEIRTMRETTHRLGNTSIARTHRAQEGVLAEKLMKVANEYQTVQQRVKAQMRERLERQYRIVRPGASAEEIQGVVLQGNQQIFTSELLSSRVGEQKRALEEVNVRHNQIQQIEAALVELFELTQEMQQMLTEQQVCGGLMSCWSSIWVIDRGVFRVQITINTIEEKVEDTVV